MNDFYFNNKKFSEIISSVNNSQYVEDKRDIKIGILRNITVDNYIPLIRYLLTENGYNTEIKQGDYDVIIQELMNSNSQMNLFSPDYLMLFMSIQQISPKVYYQYSSLTKDELINERRNILDNVFSVFEAVNSNLLSKIIFNLFELPTFPANDISESQEGYGQREFIHQINKEIVKESKQLRDIYFFDLNIVKEGLGINSYFDSRYWYIGKAPYSFEALKSIAINHFKIINNLNGKTKKCLVLDCDNTLWGGILGEDGFDNIKIGKTYPGNMFYDFQRAILELKSKGVILAINSKNNREDVINVLDNHPEMLLRKKDFACIYANWNNKAENIKNIALDLNIGLDSLVFVDDSEFECNLVKTSLPEVTVINLPKEPYKYASLIKSCGFFDKLQYTSEDKVRADLYGTEVIRKKARASYTNLEDYYKSLEMIVEIIKADDFSIPRISQLSQRTNQFNLTTRRYSEDDIKSFIASNDYDVLILKLTDKFGEMGIVGVSIIKYIKNYAQIDSLMMSCRVIGRGVESVFLEETVKLCFLRGVEYIKAEYLVSKKNRQVSDFYKEHNFEEVQVNKVGKEYKLEEGKSIKSKREYFKQIIID